MDKSFWWGDLEIDSQVREETMWWALRQTNFAINVQDDMSIAIEHHQANRFLKRRYLLKRLLQCSDLVDSIFIVLFRDQSFAIGGAFQGGAEGIKVP